MLTITPQEKLTTQTDSIRQRLSTKTIDSIRLKDLSNTTSIDIFHISKPRKGIRVNFVENPTLYPNTRQL